MKTIKKYLPTVITLSVLLGAYILAFVYSLLAVLLLTTLLFTIGALIVQLGRNAQLKEVNDRLTDSIQSVSENVGKLYLQEQVILSMLNNGDANDKEEATDDETSNNDNVSEDEQ